MRNAHLTSTPFRARIIHVVARLLGILVHIEGMPFGSARRHRGTAFAHLYESKGD